MHFFDDAVAVRLRVRPRRWLVTGAAGFIGSNLVEYLLLMVIVIGCATLLTKSLVNRSSTNPGMIIKAWDGIIKNLSNDLPDCENQSDFSTPNCPAN